MYLSLKGGVMCYFRGSSRRSDVSEPVADVSLTSMKVHQSVLDTKALVSEELHFHAAFYRLILT